MKQIFSLDEEILLSSDEMDFAYNTWKLFPDRLIGYQSRSHYWDEPSVSSILNACVNFQGLKMKQILKILFF